MVFFLSLFFLSLGSFASVLIYRLPLAGIENSNINLFLPRSHCPICKENIRLINLLPLIGYIFQAGKCEKCKTIKKHGKYLMVINLIKSYIIILHMYHI